MGRKTQGPSRGPCQAGPPCLRGTPGPAAPQADCQLLLGDCFLLPRWPVWDEDVGKAQVNQCSALPASPPPSRPLSHMPPRALTPACHPHFPKDSGLCLGLRP